MGGSMLGHGACVLLMARGPPIRAPDRATVGIVRWPLRPGDNLASGAATTRYLVNASAPALATCASCEDSAPDTPIAPTIRPSTRMGMPPSSGVMSFTARRRRPAPPAGVATPG